MRIRVSGQPLHTRSLTIEVTQREHGKHRVRADVIDLRKTSFVPMTDALQTAGIIHHMHLTARVDPSNRVLESLDVAQPFVAFEPTERTAGESCRDPSGSLQALVGQAFGDGFTAELGRRFGGPRGCSHLLTLFHLTASAVPRALALEEEQARALAVSRHPGERIFRRSVFVDGHQPDAGQLQLAVQLSDFLGTPADAVEQSIDHLARQSEVRVLATVDLKSISLSGLEAWERDRDRDTLAEAEWADRSERVEGLVGRPIMPGLGTELRRRLGDVPEARLLLDALLQLAPGFVQCTPAMTEAMYSRPAADGPGSQGGANAPLPSFLLLGGAADSCYMWREQGPLLQIRPASS